MRYWMVLWDTKVVKETGHFSASASTRTKKLLNSLSFCMNDAITFLSHHFTNVLPAVDQVDIVPQCSE